MVRGGGEDYRGSDIHTLARTMGRVPKIGVLVSKNLYTLPLLELQRSPRGQPSGPQGSPFFSVGPLGSIPMEEGVAPQAGVNTWRIDPEGED